MMLDGIAQWRSGNLAGVERAVAVHEAGHAVVAMALGWSVNEVTMNDTGGVCQIGHPPQMVRQWRPVGRYGEWRRATEEEQQAEIDRRVGRQDAIITCAGIAAQGIELGHYDDPAWFFNFGSITGQPDYFAVLGWAGLSPDPRMIEGRAARMIEEAYARAYKFLANNPASRALEALAATLLQRRTIPGPETEQIIRSARRSRSRP